MDHTSFRQAHDHVIGALVLDARVASVSDRRPLDLGMNTLSVHKLEPAISHLITPLKGFGLVSAEEGAPFSPVVVERALNDARVGHNIGPELSQLLLLRVGPICGSVEVVVYLETGTGSDLCLCQLLSFARRAVMLQIERIGGGDGCHEGN